MATGAFARPSRAQLGSGEALEALVNSECGIQPLLVLSLLFALVCVIAPRLHPGFPALVYPPLLWLLALGIGIIRYRALGLWLLIGAPLALFNLAMFAWWMWDCNYHRGITGCP